MGPGEDHRRRPGAAARVGLPGLTRTVQVAPERLARWVERFAESHGGLESVVEHGTLALTGADGACARIAIPGASGDRTPLPEAIADITTAAASEVGVLVIRRGGFSVGVATGRDLVAHRTGSRYLQGRTAAGGWSQQRFQRRRRNQAKAGLDQARRAVREVVLPHAEALTEVVAAGERAAVTDVLAADDLAPLRALLRPRMAPTGEPSLEGLRRLVDYARAVDITLDP